MMEATTATNEANRFVARVFAHALRPDPKMLPSEWSEKYMRLPAESSALPGRYRNSMAPYMVEILDCLSPHHPCNVVTFVKSAQTGGSTAAINWLGSIADMWPGPCAYFLPTTRDAKEFNETKLQPTIDATPRLKKLIRNIKSRDDQGSSTYKKKFKGGFIYIKGTNSSAGLQMLSLKNIVKDELTEWLADVEGKGDPSAIVDKRATAFPDHKIFQLSTPGIKGSCRITADFEAGDQRLLFLPCPDCGHLQRLLFDQLRFNDVPPYDTHYACEACGVLIPEHKRFEMIDQGVWIAQKPGEGRQPSFRINQLYSKLVSWDKTVQEWLDSKGKRNKEKNFCNRVMAEAWEEKGDAPEAERLRAMEQDYRIGSVPVGGLFLVGAADVQDNRIEWAIYAFGKGMTRWLVDKGIVEGDTTLDSTWTEFGKILARTYPDAYGNKLRIEKFGIDAGYRSPHVYRFVRLFHNRYQVLALDGRAGHNQPAIGTPTKKAVDRDGKRLGNVMLWPVGTWPMKFEHYSALRKLLNGPDEDGKFADGCAFFPKGLDLAFYLQLTAEAYITPQKGSGSKMGSWQKIQERNEQLDLAVYCVALAEYQTQAWDAEEWQKLQQHRQTTAELRQRDFGDIWAHRDEEATPAATPANNPPRLGSISSMKEELGIGQ